MRIGGCCGWHGWCIENRGKPKWGPGLETVYDWITVAIFGGLVVLFLQRSMAEQEPQDTILHYLPPAVGCAFANYVGNHGQGPLSALIVVAVLVYIALVLKPFGGLKF